MNDLQGMLLSNKPSYTIPTLTCELQGMLLSHTITERSRQVSPGLVLRARVDYSGRRLVLLCYLPPGGPRRHGHIACIYRVDLTDPIELVAPRIDMQVRQV